MPSVSSRVWHLRTIDRVCKRDINAHSLTASTIYSRFCIPSQRCNRNAALTCTLATTVSPPPKPSLPVHMGMLPIEYGIFAWSYSWSPSQSQWNLRTVSWKETDIFLCSVDLGIENQGTGERTKFFQEFTLLHSSRSVFSVVVDIDKLSRLSFGGSHQFIPVKARALLYRTDIFFLFEK